MVASPFTLPAIFRGSEDFQFSPHGGPTVTTTTGHFRAGFARCALNAHSPIFGYMAWRVPPSSYALNIPTSSWFTARFYWRTDTVISATGPIFSFNSAGDIPRIRLQYIGGTLSGFTLQKINAAGVATTLATASSQLAYQRISKLDIFVTYAVAGTVLVYADGDLMASYNGDVTTDGVTQLTSADLASPQFVEIDWSEVMWDERDTRSWSLATQAPTVNGNTDDWVGGVTDVNEITLNDGTSNHTDTANELQEYGVNPLPSGTWDVIDNTVAVRPMTGSVGPQSVDAVVRTHGADYSSPNITPGNSLVNTGYEWALNPATGSPWTQAELNAPEYNIGIKSVT